jgi:polyisoprenoid-binding protein YceI
MGLVVSRNFSALRRSLRLAFCFALPLFPAAVPLHAQQIAVTVDPAATEIQFTLGATMHTVHGIFKLKSGQVQWDRATGRATGAIVIDATSGNTDNSGRDKNMHAQVLESAKFPEIVFTPSQIKGTLLKNATSEIEVTGPIRIHGLDHDTTLKFAVQPAGGDLLQVATQFPVPWKSWGLKDPSTFLLHVADTASVEIHATATINP